jgi:hypothetical protein
MRFGGNSGNTKPTLNAVWLLHCLNQKGGSRMEKEGNVLRSQKYLLSSCPLPGHWQESRSHMRQKMVPVAELPEVHPGAEGANRNWWEGVFCCG